ncbi:hypothetical protein SAMN05421823_101159 [Catalinimonas alkaloidigena]|uniref:Uncharacterized protein n=1 Tax=Catalinimonas alkaloidigena TaxID=1075417 RepID=A0A1G8WRF9_9BACT|nr:hypothetical protein [Catalinimonas alkaloidigena]SDJ80666.1 hypothetical protein SAMN05421823_101159 [Catalinimonas alkaloidigena]
MRRNSRWLITLVAAVLTYGTLTAWVGPRRFHEGRWHVRERNTPCAGERHGWGLRAWTHSAASPPESDYSTHP